MSNQFICLINTCLCLEVCGDIIHPWLLAIVYIHNSDTYIHDLHFCICIVQLMTTTKLVNQSHYLCSPHQQLYSDFVELVDRLVANETDVCCFNTTDITVLNRQFQGNSDPIPAVEDVLVSLLVGQCYRY